MSICVVLVEMLVVMAETSSWWSLGKHRVLRLVQIHTHNQNETGYATRTHQGDRNGHNMVKIKKKTILGRNVVNFEISTPKSLLNGCNEALFGHKI